MIVVGLTGNLASGKSEVARLFKKKGAVVIDADEIARKLTGKGKPLQKAILKVFGKEFLGARGELDRRKLAWHVFSRPKELKKLNILIHPSVIVEVYKALEKNRRKPGVVLLDVPLLFESKMEKLADITVVVKASESTMISRASQRGIPSALARKILATQWPVMKKARLADHVITNDGPVEDLEARVEQVYAQILMHQEKRAMEFGQKNRPF